MNADELRSLQAPLKDRYRQDGRSAIVSLHATARVLPNQAACEVDCHQGTCTAGLHPAAGGDSTQACSGDMLLQALVACSGVTLSTVAVAMSIPIDSATVTASATMDFRGTLGICRETAVGIQTLNLRFEISSAASDEQLQKLVQLTERYCVVLQTLTQPSCQLTTEFCRTPLQSP